MAAYPTINQGFSGEYVELLQRALVTYGTLASDPDGAFGPETTAALNAFQQLEGLDVDGRAGEETWGRLIALGLIPPPEPFEPGTVLVQLAREVAVQAAGPTLASGAGIDLSPVNSILSAYGIENAWHLFDVPPEAQAEYDERLAAAGRSGPSMTDVVTLAFPPSADVEGIAAQLRQLPGVVDAAPNRWLTLAQQDPYLGTSSAPTGTPPTQWYIYRCRAHEAWPMSTGEDVAIGVVDSFFHVSHEDLAANFDVDRAWAVGFQAAGSIPVPSGAADHGTAVAGFAAAAGDNGLGIKGFAPDARVIPVHVDPPTAARVAWGILYLWWARKLGEPMVINVSMQRSDNTMIEGDLAAGVAIDWATTFGIPVCIAAGNSNTDTGLDLNGNPIPDRKSIVVGAGVWPDTQRANLTAWGSRVNVRAPGDGKWDTTCASPARVTPAYRTFGGTSGATPKVSGTVALMLSANPDLDPEDVREILSGTGGGPTTDAQGHPIGTFLDSWAAVHEALHRWLVKHSGESGWRWCRKCGGLHLSATNAAIGVCPVDKQPHDPSKSGNYRLVRNPTDAFGAAGWRRCGKCQALFAGEKPGSRCPTDGAAHKALGANTYSLAVDGPQRFGQSGWRRCKNCQGLFFGGGNASGGHCPAGTNKSHVQAQATGGDYVLKQV